MENKLVLQMISTFKNRLTSNKRLFPLLRYFSWVSLVCILLAAILLGLLYRDISVFTLLKHGEEKNQLLSKALANTIWPKYEKFLPRASNLNKSDLLEHPKTHAVYKELVHHVQGLNVLKVKIFDLTGYTVFSTDKDQIGVRKPADYPGSYTARTGELVSNLDFRSSFAAIDEIVFNRHVISSYLPIREPGTNRIQGIFEVYSDVTDLYRDIEDAQYYLSGLVLLILSLLYAALYFLVRHADRIIRTQAHELEIKRDIALEATTAKSAFLANMSHELRTPLNAIIGYSELIQEELPQDFPDEIKGDLEKITSSGNHLLNLINNILDLSKIEAGKMTLEPEQFQVNDKIKGVVSSTKPLADKNRNKIIVEENATVDIVTDPTKFSQIIFNLLSNALKFTQEGTITISIGLTDKVDEQWLLITVSDTGIGMTREEQQKVFHAFEQAEDSTSRKYGGTGLGLSITLQLCQLLGGELSLESIKDKGSTFKVLLPLECIAG